MKLAEFFTAHPIFRFADLANFQLDVFGLGPRSTRAVIREYRLSGKVVKIRPGMYAVVPSGAQVENFKVNRFLLAGRLAPDAVIAYHSALQLHGRAHSVSSRVTYVTRTQSKPFRFAGDVYVSVTVPTALRWLPEMGGGVVEVSCDGVPLRVTSLERTLVDVLRSPRHGMSWEEIWRSLESIESLDIEAVSDYTMKLGSAITVAKVGFFLDQNRMRLMVDHRQLERLRQFVPSQPTYLQRSRRERGRFFAGWNLVVPERLLSQIEKK